MITVPQIVVLLLGAIGILSVLSLAAVISLAIDEVNQRADRNLGRRYVAAGRGTRGGAR
jgi:hypothetical protein